MNFDTRQKLFLSLLGAFVTALVVGDIIGGKLTQATVADQVFVISVGMIPFPITFLLTDLLNEFYGKRAARLVTWIGLAMAIFAFVIITIAVQVPFAPFTEQPDFEGVRQGAFDNVFAGSQRILLASMVAYVIGQLVDITVFGFLKRVSHNRLLWLRATGSTAVSQLVDTAVIQTVAWYGVLPAATIFNIAVSSYVVKLVVAIGLTPLIYFGHAVVERGLKIPPVVLDEHGNPKL